MKDLEEIVATVVEKEITDIMKQLDEVEKLKKAQEVFQHGPEIPSSLKNSEDSKNN
jgi:hypothetical protein